MKFSLRSHKELLVRAPGVTLDLAVADASCPDLAALPSLLGESRCAPGPHSSTRPWPTRIQVQCSYTDDPHRKQGKPTSLEHAATADRSS